jgi:hypothetical protein
MKFLITAQKGGNKISHIHVSSNGNNAPAPIMPPPLFSHLVYDESCELSIQ